MEQPLKYQSVEIPEEMAENEKRIEQIIRFLELSDNGSRVIAVPSLDSAKSLISRIEQEIPALREDEQVEIQKHKITDNDLSEDTETTSENFRQWLLKEKRTDIPRGAHKIIVIDFSEVSENNYKKVEDHFCIMNVNRDMLVQTKNKVFLVIVPSQINWTKIGVYSDYLSCARLIFLTKTPKQ